MIGTSDGPTPTTPAEPRRQPRSLLTDTLVVVLLAAATVWLLNALIVTRFRVEGDSMFPALHSGEYVLVDRIGYRLTGLQRGDVIVFQYPYGPERDFIKRVIGLPGDVIDIEAGVVHVNGVALDEPYVPVPPTYTARTLLGPNQLYVLGDNRNNSADSHNWGALDGSYLVGRAIVVYWPVASARLVELYPYPQIPTREVFP